MYFYAINIYKLIYQLILQNIFNYINHILISFYVHHKLHYEN